MSTNVVGDGGVRKVDKISIADEPERTGQEEQQFSLLTMASTASDELPLSPATPFEEYFLGGSSRDLGAPLQSRGGSIRRSYSGIPRSATSSFAGTDDFLSARDVDSEFGDEAGVLFDSDVFLTPKETSPSKTNLSNTPSVPRVVFSAILEEDAQIEGLSDDDEREAQRKYRQRSTMSKETTAPVPATTVPEVATEEGAHFDVAQKVYEGVKDAWTWGKGVIVFSPFMGLAEAVASKVVSTATSGAVPEFGDLDAHLKPLVAIVDKTVVDPAIGKIIDIVTPAVETTVPAVLAVIKPISFGLIKDENETPASGKKAEVTPPEMTQTLAATK